SFEQTFAQKREFYLILRVSMLFNPENMKITLPGWINRLTAHAWLLLIIIGVQLSATTANAAPWLDQQTVSVSGKVVSPSDPEGIPGVNIIIKGTSMGTVTDAKGGYKLDVPDKNAVLVFSAIG